MGIRRSSAACRCACRGRPAGQPAAGVRARGDGRGALYHGRGAPISRHPRAHLLHYGCGRSLGFGLEGRKLFSELSANLEGIHGVFGTIQGHHLEFF